VITCTLCQFQVVLDITINRIMCAYIGLPGQQCWTCYYTMGCP